ncbi:DUF418 domain-containing protein [Mucilaginibacter pedocola]|uniref:DUF418 domain-containing protein n=1 Tax=Mucilaginibacter pedocola TaxID=1792845 RepID=A0A1S9PIM7_9SPHI|nr:DUF418 domain-containing protein [Mucilaginibacter pedocola]OOQ60428.1 hypothetical protein BC343_25790 [Mucilaginibacter pedocola]
MALSKNTRIDILDQIRGIALLGILIFNIQTYSFYALLRPEQVYALGIDRPESYAPAQFLIHLLIKGQFYTIYSFLFGLGFYLMWQKNNAAGLPADRLFRRRLWALLLFGLLHGLVLWFGDVLHKYALLGFSLLYFNRKPVPALLKWIGVFLGLLALIQFFKVFFFPQTAASAAQSHEQFDAVVMQVLDAWQDGSVLSVMGFQKLGMLMVWVQNISEGLVGVIHFQIMFLVGLIAGKAGIFYHLPEWRNKLSKWAWWAFLVGLPIKCISCLDVFDIHFGSLPYAWSTFVVNVSSGIGTLLLAVAYLVALALGLNGRRPSVQQWIGNTGRMGLTNYLGQSLLCAILFYGYGFGLSGQLTLLQTFLPVLLIYSLQVIFSNIWLRYYTSGPMESLWRRMTYFRC